MESCKMALHSIENKLHNIGYVIEHGGRDTTAVNYEVQEVEAAVSQARHVAEMLAAWILQGVAHKPNRNRLWEEYKPKIHEAITILQRDVMACDLRAQAMYGYVHDEKTNKRVTKVKQAPALMIAGAFDGITHSLGEARLALDEIYSGDMHRMRNPMDDRETYNSWMALYHEQKDNKTWTNVGPGLNNMAV
jgi:hypothetical protein